MRRMVLAGLAIVAAITTFEVPTANAQVSSGRNPWCLRDGPGGRGSWDCSYQTFEQCNFSSVYGSDGSCTRNPNYRGGGQSRNPQQEPQGTWGWGGGGNRW